MQIAQGFLVVQPGRFGEHGFQQIEQSTGLVCEQCQHLPGIDPGLGPAFIEPAFEPCSLLGGRHPDEGQKIATLEMRAMFGKLGCALFIHEGRYRIGEGSRGIVLRRAACSFDKDGPG